VSAHPVRTSLQPETRGPTARLPAHSLLTDSGPLVSGPLGPLVSDKPRLGLEQLIAPLEREWAADPETGLFQCPLPEHTGHARLDVPLEDPQREIRLLCCRGRWRSLGEVRAASAYGVDHLRSNIELAVWLRRLAHEHGCFAPVAVSLPMVPAGTAEHVEQARRGFELLIGLRWADLAPRPVAYSVRFAAAWCGLSLRAAHVARTELCELGVIVEAGRVGRIPLFAPGGDPHRIFQDVSGDGR
jgi:hypothetical protein